MIEVEKSLVENLQSQNDYYKYLDLRTFLVLSTFSQTDNAINTLWDVSRTSTERHTTVNLIFFVIKCAVNSNHGVVSASLFLFNVLLRLGKDPPGLTLPTTMNTIL